MDIHHYETFIAREPEYEQQRSEYINNLLSVQLSDDLDDETDDIEQLIMEIEALRSEIKELLSEIRAAENMLKTEINSSEIPPVEIQK